MKGGGMELWAIVPELILGAAVLVLLPLGSLLPDRRKGLTAWLALGALGAALGVSAAMLGWPPQPIFEGTYAVDPFAVYFKLFGLSTTALVLLAAASHFRGHPAGAVPPLLLLACLGLLGLAAAQDLALIALFFQLVAVSSYILVGLARERRAAGEAAVKILLYSAVTGAAMLFGMSVLYGLSGTLQLPQLAARLPPAASASALAGLGLVVAGYGYKVTLVPLHPWAPDAYQGAPTPITAFLAVGAKGAGMAVLLRTLLVAFPELDAWRTAMAVLAAVTMTAGNLLALLQTSTKRLLAWSSIGQAGYLFVGVAAAGRQELAVVGFVLYLAVYLFMELGAFLSVEALERQTGSDELTAIAGLGRRLPLAAGVLALSLLSLAGIPPLGGFVAKAVLLAAALGAGWTWLAVVLAVNVVFSLYYFVRLLAALYLGPRAEGPLRPTAPGLSFALLALGLGSLLSGVFPEPWFEVARRASVLLLR